MDKKESLNQLRSDFNGSSQDKRLGTVTIILLILGSPIWFSLLIAAFSVAFSLYVSLWAVIVSLWSVFGALCGCSIGGVVDGVIMAANSYTIPGIALIGAGLVCGGLAIFAFFGCKAATKGIVFLTKKMAKLIFKKKEDVNNA